MVSSPTHVWWSEFQTAGEGLISYFLSVIIYLYINSKHFNCDSQ